MVARVVRGRRADRVRQRSFWMLLTCRFMLGLFEAGNWPCGIRTIRAVLPPEERSFGNSLFQSGTALGAVITPLLVLSCSLGRSGESPDASWRSPAAPTPRCGARDTWQFPFRVIGSLGLVWVVLWFVTVPQAMLNPTDATGAAARRRARSGSRDVFRDRRFWVLVAMVDGDQHHLARLPHVAAAVPPGAARVHARR